MSVILIPTKGDAKIVLDKPIVLIGRHEECDIQIKSRKVSRRHCCIAQVGDHLVVRDLGSTNGIRINGVKALEGRVRSGDELTIANRTYRPRWEPRDRRLGEGEAAEQEHSSEELSIPE